MLVFPSRIFELQIKPRVFQHLIVPRGTQRKGLDYFQVMDGYPIRSWHPSCILLEAKWNIFLDARLFWRGIVRKSRNDISDLDKNDVYSYKIISLGSATRYKEAIDLCLAALKKLGCDLSRNRFIWSIRAVVSIICTAKQAKQFLKEHYESLPLMTDPTKVATVDLPWSRYLSNISIIARNDLLEYHEDDSFDTQKFVEMTAPIQINFHHHMVNRTMHYQGNEELSGSFGMPSNVEDNIKNNVQNKILVMDLNSSTKLYSVKNWYWLSTADHQHGERTHQEGFFTDKSGWTWSWWLSRHQCKCIIIIPHIIFLLKWIKNK